jgi:hypothetical protein
MSSNWIILIPEDPRFVPDGTRQALARDRLAEIAPGADEITIEVYDRVEFFHCGSNFEQILCPSCGAVIPVSWWQNRMDEDFGDGFKLAEYPTPCCRAGRTLHDLVYEWPQGFGRFALEAMNRSIGKLEECYRRELEEMLGTTLRVIYRHM